jgi:hypothetical protein
MKMKTASADLACDCATAASPPARGSDRSEEPGVTVIEQMQKAAIGMANEEEDGMIAGIARIMVLEAALRDIVENTNWQRSDCALRARMALEN